MEKELREESALVYFNGRCRFKGPYSQCLKIIAHLQATEPINEEVARRLKKKELITE